MGPVAIASAALLISISAHFAAARLHAKRVSSYGLSLLAGIAATGFLGGLFTAFNRADFLAAYLLFFPWWFIFLNFVQTSQSSLRVHVLREMMRAGGAISRPALAGRYDNRALVMLRLERLLSGGAILERNGSYFVNSGALKFLARFFR